MIDNLSIVKAYALKVNQVKRLLVGSRYSNGSYRTKHISNQLNSLVGHLAVDRHIEVAALYYSHKTNKAFNLSVNKHQNRFAKSLSGFLTDSSTYTLRIGLPFSKGQRVLVISNSGLVCPPRCRVV